jgi:hypothetical protein
VNAVEDCSDAQECQAGSAMVQAASCTEPSNWRRRIGAKFGGNDYRVRMNVVAENAGERNGSLCNRRS